jgi:hypothetical protein
MHRHLSSSALIMSCRGHMAPYRVPKLCLCTSESSLSAAELAYLPGPTAWVLGMRMYVLALACACLCNIIICM